ncbi:MAG TPA: hypothetical protein VLA72_03005 [Anaerolineales bacterium]|nr:hypothetical protein [Anaerolineales bacterium]
MFKETCALGLKFIKFQHEWPCLSKWQNHQTTETQAKNHGFQVEMKTIWNDHVGRDLFQVHLISDRLARKNKQSQANKKDQRHVKAMVLRFLSDSREISFRLDDCLTRKAG